MKKSQMYKKVNRKTKFFNHLNRNVVYPTLFFNPNIEGNKSSVEITEIHSEEDISESEQQDNHNTDNSWYNTSDRSQAQGNEYEINRSARDKKHQNNDNIHFSTCSDKDMLNQFCSEFYGIDCYDRGEIMPTVNDLHSEFFTIINNHSSETSSDSNQYDDIEVIQCEDSKQNDYWNNNNFYDNKNAVHDNDSETEKRMIWIYALKNKRYLTEHDYEFIDLPRKESISTTDDEESTNDIPNSRRIATPIPTYIPRMNLPLSPTLPTVTEVTEPNKQASNNSDISIKVTDRNLSPRPTSGWFDRETSPRNENNSPVNKKKSFECNRQALSPRERRRLKESELNKLNGTSVKKDSATHVYCEPTIVVPYKELSPELHIETFERQITETEKDEDDQSNIINEEKQVSSEVSKEDCTSNISLCNLQKPQIKLNTEIQMLKKDITDPIEKLDGNWIGQSTPEDELFEVYDYNVNAKDKNVPVASQRTGDAIEECASDRLFINNTYLLKPAEWTQYLPLIGSVPSLHLSLSVESDIDNEKKSWFKRFLHTVNCCK